MAQDCELCVECLYIYEPVTNGNFHACLSVCRRIMLQTLGLALFVGPC